MEVEYEKSVLDFTRQRRAQVKFLRRRRARAFSQDGVDSVATKGKERDRDLKLDLSLLRLIKKMYEWKQGSSTAGLTAAKLLSILNLLDEVCHCLQLSTPLGAPSADSPLKGFPTSLDRVQDMSGPYLSSLSVLFYFLHLARLKAVGASRDDVAFPSLANLQQTRGERRRSQVGSGRGSVAGSDTSLGIVSSLSLFGGEGSGGNRRTRDGGSMSGSGSGSDGELDHVREGEDEGMVVMEVLQALRTSMCDVLGQELNQPFHTTAKGVKDECGKWYEECGYRCSWMRGDGKNTREVLESAATALLSRGENTEEVKATSKFSSAPNGIPTVRMHGDKGGTAAVDISSADEASRQRRLLPLSLSFEGDIGRHKGGDASTFVYDTDGAASDTSASDQACSGHHAALLNCLHTLRIVQPALLHFISPSISHIPPSAFTKKGLVSLLSTIQKDCFPHIAYLSHGCAQHKSGVDWMCVIRQRIHEKGQVCTIDEEELVQIATPTFVYYNAMTKERFFLKSEIDPSHNDADGLLQSSCSLSAIIHSSLRARLLHIESGSAQARVVGENEKGGSKEQQQYADLSPLVRGWLRQWRSWAEHQTTLHPHKRTTKQLCYLISEVRRLILQLEEWKRECTKACSSSRQEHSTGRGGASSMELVDASDVEEEESTPARVYAGGKNTRRTPPSSMHNRVGMAGGRGRSVPTTVERLGRGIRGGDGGDRTTGVKPLSFPHLDEELFELNVVEGVILDALREDSFSLSRQLWSALPKSYFKSKDGGIVLGDDVSEGQIVTGSISVYGKGAISTVMADIHRNVLLPASASLTHADKELKMEILYTYAASIVHFLLAKAKETPMRITSYGGHKIGADVRFLMAWLRSEAMSDRSVSEVEGIAEIEEGRGVITSNGTRHAGRAYTPDQAKDRRREGEEWGRGESIGQEGGSTLRVHRESTSTAGVDADEVGGHVMDVESVGRSGKKLSGKKGTGGAAAVSGYELERGGSIAPKTPRDDAQTGPFFAIFERALCVTKVLTLSDVEAAYQAGLLSDGPDWMQLRRGPLKKKGNEERKGKKRLCS